MKHSHTPSEDLMLNNPIWYALSTEQRGLAIGNDLAKRFPEDVAPLGGAVDQSPASYEGLARVPSTGRIVLFLEDEPALPGDWVSVHSDQICQMICERPVREGESQLIRPLTSADVPEMLALTELTEPGPFRTRTIELGTYLGIHDSGRLAAMAGERLHLTGFTEVSAVCTHPDFRGRGYGKALLSVLISQITQRGETPILHVRTSNTSAIELYKKLGFQVRAVLHLAVVRHGAVSTSAPSAVPQQVG